MKLQDLIARYAQDELSNVEINTDVRLQEVQLAIIMTRLADLISFPRTRPSPQAGAAAIGFSNDLFARNVQTRVVNFIEKRRKLEQAGKRKRTITGSVSGVV